MFNLFKKKPKTELPKVKYEDHYLNIEEEDKAIRKYEKNTDDLIENDDFHMTKKEMIDEPYQGKFFKYEPTEFDCYLKGVGVYDLDDTYIGDIKKRDLKYLEDYHKAFLVFYHGKYKWTDGDNVYTEKGYSYFKLHIIKRLS